MALCRKILNFKLFLLFFLYMAAHVYDTALSEHVRMFCGLHANERN